MERIVQDLRKVAVGQGPESTVMLMSQTHPII